MHVSQAWLISLQAGLRKAIRCALNSYSMKGATLTNTQQVGKIPPITFFEPPNATLFGIFKLAGHFQQC
jgi:hypothetical protein